MIKTETYVSRLEEELRTTRSLSPGICESFAALSAEDQVALSGALAFLGCTDVHFEPRIKVALVPETLRVAAARLMLLKLWVDTDEPRWSSWLLDRLLDTAVSVPGGASSDVVRALFELFGEKDELLSRTSTHFVKDVTRLCIWVYGKSYHGASFLLTNRIPGNRLTIAQAYLALYSLRVSDSPELEYQIRQALAGTRFEEEATLLLQQDESD